MLRYIWFFSFVGCRLGYLGVGWRGVWGENGWGGFFILRGLGGFGELCGEMRYDWDLIVKLYGVGKLCCVLTPYLRR